jgi:hypothetical protein
MRDLCILLLLPSPASCATSCLAWCQKFTGASGVMTEMGASCLGVCRQGGGSRGAAEKAFSRGATQRKPAVLHGRPHQADEVVRDGMGRFWTHTRPQVGLLVVPVRAPPFALPSFVASKSGPSRRCRRHMYVWSAPNSWLVVTVMLCLVLVMQQVMIKPFVIVIHQSKQRIHFSRQVYDDWGAQSGKSTPGFGTRPGKKR